MKGQINSYNEVASDDETDSDDEEDEQSDAGDTTDDSSEAEYETNVKKTILSTVRKRNQQVVRRYKKY